MQVGTKMIVAVRACGVRVPPTRRSLNAHFLLEFRLRLVIAPLRSARILRICTGLRNRPLRYSRFVGCPLGRSGIYVCRHRASCPLEPDENDTDALAHLL